MIVQGRRPYPNILVTNYQDVFHRSLPIIYFVLNPCLFPFVTNNTFKLSPPPVIRQLNYSRLKHVFTEDDFMFCAFNHHKFRFRFSLLFILSFVNKIPFLQVHSALNLLLFLYHPNLIGLKKYINQCLTY